MPRSLPVCLALLLAVTPSFAAKPKYASPVVTPVTKGQSTTIDVEITGATRLYLVVNDAGDGYGCDWANWVDPRFVDGDGGETRLTTQKWQSATVGWGQARVGRNAGGGEARVAGKPVEDVIGVHANSMLVYAVPAGTTRFKATGALDDGGTGQGCGSTVKFLVFTEKPDAQYLVSKGGGGGDTGLRDAEDALSGLDVHEDLQAEVFAAEPYFSNPTNIDVDHRGRVWVCEVVNYRAFRNKKDRPEGDRILILEDTAGDGLADMTHVFYQGRDVDSAHGICVLPTPGDKGTRVIVSCGDKVFSLFDDDGDLKADRKEILFTGISGTQHDHGIHAFVFGPDGKLYFNFGNAGKQIRDKDGNPITDKAGNVVNDSRKPYQEGMVFRCNLDGSEFETLGWNFRNNWEVCVDSFGNIWQSDNDDDGNRGVRINFVMEGGNYGYKDELTGAGWRSPRTGMHEEIPKRHWHLNDPGVVPNLLQTGAGSPTGICVYEGDLLPEVFRGQIIHCDAGPNVVRAYPVKPDGAGYTAEMVNILHGARDKWFRPSDVCVAPDGSLFVADWYDPGVGGHAMGDVDRGRLFRVTPKGHEGYAVPEYDFTTAKGAAEALKSPNQAVRYIAWRTLHGMGEKSLPVLATLFESHDGYHRARALWLAAKIDGAESEMLLKAFDDGVWAIRMAALRAARQIGGGFDEKAILSLHDDEAPPVRREVAIALREAGEIDPGASAETKQLISKLLVDTWVQLARLHDGEDRWYLEALGIGARGRWDELFTKYMENRDAGSMSKATRDIVWRARTPKALPYLRDVILSEEVDDAERLRYFRAFDFHPNSPEKNAALVALIAGDHENQSEITALALKHGAKVDLNNPATRKAIDLALDEARGTIGFVNLVETLKVTDRDGDLLALAQKHPDEELGVRAITALLNANRKDAINAAIDGEDRVAALATLQAIGNSGNGKAVNYTLPLVEKDDVPLERRRAAVAAMAKVKNGAARLLNMAEKKQLDEQLVQVAASSLHSAQWPDVRQQATKLFPLPPSKDAKPLPPLEQLVKMQGDWKKGRVLFHSTATCAKCHKVDGQGKEVGPDLTEIGSKLSRTAMFQSILYPSAGISHNYETYVVVTVDGNQLTGVLTNRTDESITLKGADAIPKTVRTDDIDEIVKQPISLMPADIQKLVTAEELVDLVDYLQTLKKKKRGSRSGTRSCVATRRAFHVLPMPGASTRLRGLS